MRLKLAVVAVYGLGIIAPAALLARPAVLTSVPQDASSQAARNIITLDQKGTRGMVFFDHRLHEAFINPDPGSPFEAKQTAACVGCHHTESRAKGVPQLWKCNACHKGEGHPNNPKNREFDEVMAERAFHDSCIGCHRATNEKAQVNKSPTTCGGCHKSVFSSLDFEKALDSE